jgi:transposase InsO family protein
VKFGFIAKHWGIWPADWFCGALGVSRGGFYAWLRRPRSRRSRSDEELGAKVRASFLASDRTYGARRVWHDLLAGGVTCGLHRIERLMRLQAVKARPRRCRLPPDLVERQVVAVAPNVPTAASRRLLPTANGLPTSPTSGPRKAGSMLPPSSIFCITPIATASTPASFPVTDSRSRRHLLDDAVHAMSGTMQPWGASSPR